MNKNNSLNFFPSVMSIATDSIWISTMMKMLLQTGEEIYNHTLNVALLVSCMVKEDEKPDYDPDAVILGALLHDIGYVGTLGKAQGKPVEEMTELEKFIFEQHIKNGVDHISKYTSDQTVIDIVSKHHEYLDGTGYPDGLKAPDIPKHVRIVTAANEFVKTVASHEQAFELDSWSNAKKRVDLLAQNGKIDAEILQLLHKSMFNVGILLGATTTHFQYNDK